MAYVKATDFAAKDALLTGNPAKIVKGTEIDTEFTAIQASDALNVKLTGAQTLEDKVIALGDNTVSGTKAQFDTACTDGNFLYVGDVSSALPMVDVTANGTSTINTFELCNKTSALARTMPSGAAVGDQMGYKDNGQMFATYSLTITPPTGHAIEDLATNETLVVTTNYLAFTLRQVSSGLWRIF